MAHPTQVEEALALALQLAPGDRLRLVERLVASVEHEIAAPSRREEHWGKHLLQVLEGLDFTDWTDIDTDDPVEWVKLGKASSARAANPTRVKFGAK
jgi:putative IMPACT (imprinted ancient) family translation regulator